MEKKIYTAFPVVVSTVKTWNIEHSPFGKTYITLEDGHMITVPNQETCPGGKYEGILCKGAEVAYMPSVILSDSQTTNAQSTDGQV